VRRRELLGRAFEDLLHHGLNPHVLTNRPRRHPFEHVTPQREAENNHGLLRLPRWAWPAVGRLLG
jgi:hypothetical protein